VPMSHFVTALRQLPMATSALHALPEPWVRGIDYMAAYSETGGSGYLHGRIGPGFWDYYLLSLATKMPAPLLLLLPVALLWRRPRWPRGMPLLVAAGIAVPLLWLSLKQSLQIGLRHMLQVIPLLIVVAAQPLGQLWDHGLRGSRRAGRALVSMLLAGSAAALLHAWPDCIGSFNVLTPGPAYLWFRDSNFDWSWKRADDSARQRLLARHPGAGRVYPLSGPRLGLVYAHGADLCQGASADGRADHWLRRFAPIDRERGWYLYRVDAAAFAALAAAHPGDLRLQQERASALVTSGAPQQGLEALGAAPDNEFIRRAAAMALAQGGFDALQYAQAEHAAQASAVEGEDALGGAVAAQMVVAGAGAVCHGAASGGAWGTVRGHGLRGRESAKAMLRRGSGRRQHP